MAGRVRPALVLLALGPVLAEPVAAGVDCAAGESCPAEAGPSTLHGAAAPEYHWPHARGKVGQLGTTEHAGPVDLKSALAWRWHHPAGRFETMLKGAPLIDHELNIYLQAVDKIYKFSQAGQLLWEWQPSVRVPKWNSMTNCPSLHAGAIFGSTVNGYVFSVSMETGREQWIKKVYEGLPNQKENAVGGDTGNVDAHDGVVVSAGGIWFEEVVAGNTRVTGVNTTDGELLWDFKVDDGMWNFAAHFLPAGAHGVEVATVLFQDVRGFVYRLALHTGSLIWKSEGGMSACWTDGSMNIGPDGLAYSVTVTGGRYDGPSTPGGPELPGYVFATNLSTGKLKWKATMPRPPNSMPVPLRSRGQKYSMVLPIGQQAGAPPMWRDMIHNWDWERGTLRPWDTWFWHKLSLLLGDWGQSLLWHNPTLPNDIVSLDSETGAMNWRWRGPEYKRPAAMGDEEGLLVRLKVGKMFGCLPCPWGYPAADARGTIYVGNQDGKLYALRESGTDGGLDVLSTIDLEACFLCGSGGVTFAPGLMAVATCDSLFVFRT